MYSCIAYIRISNTTVHTVVG